MSKKMIYLDYAAATPMDESVLAAMQPYFTEKFYNPSATYLPARAVKDNIIHAKKSIAGHLGAKHTEIIHTSGGTEANNLAISGIMDRFPKAKLLVSSVEHESVLNPAGQYDCGLIPIDKYGVVKLDALEKMMDDKVVLISVMLVNNETGSIQPVRKIAEIIKRAKKARLTKPIYLHTDACQAPCYLDLNANRLGVDLMTLNGGKIYGPKGSGVLFVKSGVEISPQLLGGGQQRGLRSGTENPAGLVGFARALDVVVSRREAETDRIKKLRDDFISRLLAVNPETIINSSPKRYAPHILNVSFPGIDNERLLFQLEDEGILAAAGSACSASSQDPSHVLSAMGISDELAKSSVRFSFGRQTTQADLDHLLNRLQALFA